MKANRVLLATLLTTAYGLQANTIYVSDVYGHDDTGTGTLADPVKTIQVGLDKLTSWGSTLIISNGTYKLEETIQCRDAAGHNGITIRSLSDNPKDVIIDGQNKVQCFRSVGNSKVIRGLTFQNGRSETNGAGISLNGNSWEVANCIVSNCHVVGTGKLYGGGLYANRALKLSDTAFYDCSVESTSGSDAEGGGFSIGYSYNESGEGLSRVSNVRVRGCAAKARYARGGGVAINYVDVDGLVVENCQSLNTYPSTALEGGVGGGIFKRTYRETVLENVLVTNCLANAHGGGLSTSGSNDDGVLRMRNCSFVDNRIEAVPSTKNVCGGGVHLSNSTYDIAHSRFAKNRIATTAAGTGEGAGVYMGGKRVNLTDSVIENNVTDQGYGGGIKSAVPCVISNCVIAANSAYQRCALWLEDCQGALVTDCYVVSNTASKHSIGRLRSPSSFSTVIRNSYFEGNGGETGNYGASLIVFSLGAPVSLEYCTFVSNVVNSTQSYVLTPSANNPASATETNANISNLFVKGCVFSSNCGKPAFPKCMNTVTNITSTYSDTFQADWWTTERRLNNYNKAMLGNVLPFVDLATDRRLKKGCSLIDRGVTEAWMGDGSKRGQLDMGDGTYTIAKSGVHGVSVMRNNAVPRLSGTGVDFGCFEYLWPKGLVLIYK